MNVPIIYSPEVRRARNRRRPLVALETTIISHGLPYPRNIECALTLEQTVRENGAVPATLAILDGVVRVGLGEPELLRLGKPGAGQRIHKVSRADLPFVIANRLDGATTVAGTMIVAHLAGIRFFATGGIGGVHRGAETTFDISADLEELARTPVTVVSAGAKAILDIPKTLEYLETKGVPVIGYRTDTFPLFYTRRSRHRLNLVANDLAAIASFIRVKEALGYTGGLLVANPVPAADELKASYIDGIIARALRSAAQKKITGKAVTPFLLDAIYRMTEGRSLATNVALVTNNAAVAARLAVAAHRGGR